MSNPHCALKLHFTSVVLLAFLLFSLLLACGSSNKSAAQGVLIDKSGNPIQNATIVALQLNPLKGYEKVICRVNKEGHFTLKGMYPESRYKIGIKAILIRL